MNRRDFVRVLPGTALLTAAPVFAHSDYPKKPIRLVVPFAPGGISDLLDRMVAEALATLYSMPVIVDNRPGASGHIGAQQVAVAPPDGYTLTGGTIAIHAAYDTYKKLNYKPAADLRPITVLAEAGNIVLVPVSSPYKTFGDFLADARNNPGKLSYGSAGTGSSVHMVTALFELMSKTQLLHVPYKGSGPALTDLISGQLQVMFDNISSGMPFVQSGRLRVLAVTGAQREPTLPDIPTVAEAGVPGYSGTSWWTLAAPRGVPAALCDEIQQDVRRVLSTPEAKLKFDAMAVRPVLNTPQQAAEFFKAETIKWKSVIDATKLQLD